MNSPPGAYIGIVAAEAESLGAVPMFTLYQMAANGGGNLSGLSDNSFMSAYWANVKLMFQDIAAIGKPTLVNFEPDFWGYVQQQATNGDPTKMFAYVNTNPDCASLSNDVVGVAGCLIAMAHKYAPKAYLGFPPSTWGAPTRPPPVIAFMNAIGAQNADFIALQTLWTAMPAATRPMPRLQAATRKTPRRRGIWTRAIPPRRITARNWPRRRTTTPVSAACR